MVLDDLQVVELLEIFFQQFSSMFSSMDCVTGKITKEIKCFLQWIV